MLVHIVVVFLVATGTVVLAGDCEGWISPNETCKAPQFYNNVSYDPDHQCYSYRVGPVLEQTEYTMTVEVNESDYIIWWSCNDTPPVSRSYFTWEDDNKTMTWSNPDSIGEVIFFATAVRKCGNTSVNATACFTLNVDCQLCIGNTCPLIPFYTTSAKKYKEHSNLHFGGDETSIWANPSVTLLLWYYESDSLSVSCYCDNQAGYTKNCSMPDWKLTTTFGEPGDPCSYKYSCELNISDISMKYNGGVFKLGSIIDNNPSMTKNFTTISVAVDKDNSRLVLFASIGAVMVVATLAAVLVAVLVYRRSRSHPSLTIRELGHDESSRPLVDHPPPNSSPNQQNYGTVYAGDVVDGCHSTDNSGEEDGHSTTCHDSDDVDDNDLDGNVYSSSARSV